VNLAIVGYGKMGRLIDQLAPEYGFAVKLRLDIDNNANYDGMTNDNFRGIDAAVEFSTPATAIENIERLARLGVNSVIGTTGWFGELDRARTAVNAFVEAHPGTSVEDKGRTIAVHFRMAPQHESSVRESLVAITNPLRVNYHIQEGNMVLEIKPRGFSKGAAIKTFMQEPPFSGRRPVFVGDDLTDQGGFRVVEEQGGISVAVGDRVRGQFGIDDPAAVRSWLRGIAALHGSRHE